jgi:hypothetical protein
MLDRLASPAKEGDASTRHNRAKDSTTPLQPPAAVAYVKVLLLLPADQFVVAFPRFVLRVCGALKSKMQSERDSAKQTLVQIALTVGPAHLRMILEEARRCLSSGFAVHVLGHVCHAVLLALAPQLSANVPTVLPGEDVRAMQERLLSVPLSPGSAVLVDCLPLLLEIVMDDVLGAAAETRQQDSGYAPKVWSRLRRMCVCV